MSRSKSVSFNDLVKIRHVPRIILAAVALNANYLLSSQMRKQAYKSASPDSVQLIWNLELMGGVLLILVGLISSTGEFRNRRITAIVLCILFVTFWDVVWISFTDIYEEVMHGLPT